MPLTFLVPPVPMKPGRYEWILWVDGKTDKDWHYALTFMKQAQAQAA